MPILLKLKNNTAKMYENLFDLEASLNSEYSQDSIQELRFSEMDFSDKNTFFNVLNLIRDKQQIPSVEFIHCENLSIHHQNLLADSIQPSTEVYIRTSPTIRILINSNNAELNLLQALSLLNLFEKCKTKNRFWATRETYAHYFAQQGCFYFEKFSSFQIKKYLKSYVKLALYTAKGYQKSGEIELALAYYRNAYNTIIQIENLQNMEYRQIIFCLENIIHLHKQKNQDAPASLYETLGFCAGLILEITEKKFMTTFPARENADPEQIKILLAFIRDSASTLNALKYVPLLTSDNFSCYTLCYMFAQPDTHIQDEIHTLQTMAAIFAMAARSNNNKEVNRFISLVKLASNHPTAKELKNTKLKKYILSDNQKCKQLTVQLEKLEKLNSTIPYIQSGAVNFFSCHNRRMTNMTDTAAVELYTAGAKQGK